MKKTFLAGSVVGMALLALPVAVSADTLNINFEPPTYTTGNIHGQDSWSAFGSAGSGCAPYDVAVSEAFGVPSFGSQSMRISNAVTSGCFGDQTFTKSLINEAGEANAATSTYSGGSRRNRFEAQFDIRPMTLRQQSGLFLSVSPDRGDGARMSYVGFRDDPDGIRVNFYDVQGTSSSANFVETVIATGLSRAITHTVKFEIDFVEGPSNDVVKIYVDGVLKHTGTTWENYYRFDPESNPGLVNESRRVDSLLFRVGGTAAPATLNNGFLVDNISLVSKFGSPITWNPADKSPVIVLSPDNTDMGASSQQTNHNSARATMGMPSGKWYWEVYVSNGPGSQGNVNLIGIQSQDSQLGPSPYGYTSNGGGLGWGYGTDQGLFYPNGFTMNPSFPIHSSGLPTAPSLTSGWKRFAYNADNGNFWIGDASGWFGGGDPATGSSPTATRNAGFSETMFAAGSLYYVTADKGYKINYGSSAFQFAVPNGFEI